MGTPGLQPFLQEVASPRRTGSLGKKDKLPVLVVLATAADGKSMGILGNKCLKIQLRQGKGFELKNIYIFVYCVAL
ncbi:MAG: hypothetical protein PHX94_05000 [Bacteroidales bacterium]|nr:hypothetical protein [Bacteroidales bacterium]